MSKARGVRWCAGGFEATEFIKKIGVLCKKILDKTIFSWYLSDMKNKDIENYIPNVDRSKFMFRSLKITREKNAQIKAAAKARGISANAFILAAVDYSLAMLESGKGK